MTLRSINFFNRKKSFFASSTSDRAIFLRALRLVTSCSRRLSSASACLIWTLFFQEHYFPRYGIDSVEVGVAASLILFVVVSRLTKPSATQNLDVFFSKEGGG